MRAADALAKYSEERDKRLAASRADIAGLTGPFARCLEDPHTPRSERAPVSEELEVLVVGAGLGGLVAAAGRFHQPPASRRRRRRGRRVVLEPLSRRGL